MRRQHGHEAGNQKRAEYNRIQPSHGSSSTSGRSTCIEYPEAKTKSFDEPRGATYSLYRTHIPSITPSARKVRAIEILRRKLCSPSTTLLAQGCKLSLRNVL